MTTPYERFPYGARVKWSDQWPGMHSRKPKVKTRAESKRGTIVTARFRMDGRERVQWDNTGLPETIARKFLEIIE